MFIIDIQSKVPIFEQLKKQILEFISIGILLPNDKLPSVRSLATDIGVNPNTVSKAYQELENQGYIYSIKGKGCFIADNQTDQLIKDDKLDDFKGCVNEMKKHQITKDKLLEIIEEVYKEETVWMKSFENKNVLNHLNVTISSGSIFGLIGPNGAGKSTLLYLLNGISKCDEGSILFDGKDVYENPDVKKDILFISDDPYYFHFATIDEMKDFYLTFYPQFNLETYQHYVDLFRLPQNKPLKDYSKGMKRQAMFALALAIAPKYLLLDEAFDGLDPVMRLAFKKAINQMIDENMTVIISSHNLRELEDICDSFGILDNGCMTTSGDLYDIKDHIHKIQLAFKEELNKEEFSHLDVLSFHKQSRVINMVVKGDINEIKDYLRMFNPIMLVVLPVNLEEIFIYEMERKGYGVYD
mgnify:CR=1 FL=1